MRHLKKYLKNAAGISINELRMLSGPSEIARNTLIEFMKLADLEIEGAESVLYLLQPKRQHA
jgi:hypothetical protein